jgi:DNA topoisomerase VI subunit B
MSTTLQRTAFVTSRSLEFFSESELTTQLGYGRTLWPLIITKELIDNVLDAVESIDAAPVVDITLEPDALTISDNGPGIPSEVIEKSLDYSVRISDKKHYISPTRGQLGNALKCVWAAPFVATGEKAHAVVIGRGLRHEIRVSLDRIQQKPDIKLTTQKLRSVKNGSSVRIDWKGIASSAIDDEDADFYHSGSLSDQLPDLVFNFATFNPHATFRLKFPGAKPAIIKPSDKSWSKWRTSDPTSPHWYRPEDLRALIAAYISSDERKTLRDFVREFAGLSGTQIAKRVLHQAKLTAFGLADLVSHGNIDMRLVERLLDVMKKHSRPVKPQRLGIIGFGHFARHAFMVGLTPHSMRYKKIVGFDGDLPFVVEVAFGLRKTGRRHFVCGLNNSAVFKMPTDDLSCAMTEARIDEDDPVVLQVHICSPRFEFLDHGKGSFVSGPEMSYALAKAIELTAREFTHAKRRAAAAKRDRLTPEQIEHLRAKEEKKKEKKSNQRRCLRLHGGGLP